MSQNYEKDLMITYFNHFWTVYVFCEEDNFYKLHKLLLHQSYTILSFNVTFSNI